MVDCTLSQSIHIPQEGMLLAFEVTGRPLCPCVQYPSLAAIQQDGENWKMLLRKFFHLYSGDNN